MKLIGDQEGIAELKKISKERKEFLKFIIGEAQSNTDYTATFRSIDETTKYKIVFNPKTKELNVERAP